jgi:hypothetical protein
MSKAKYANAIKYRQSMINRLRNDPPAEWTAEYTEKNIRLIEEQIVHLKASGKRVVDEF